MNNEKMTPKTFRVINQHLRNYFCHAENNDNFAYFVIVLAPGRNIFCSNPDADSSLDKVHSGTKTGVAIWALLKLNILLAGVFFTGTNRVGAVSGARRVPADDRGLITMDRPGLVTNAFGIICNGHLVSNNFIQPL